MKRFGSIRSLCNALFFLVLSSSRWESVHSQDCFSDTSMLAEAIGTADTSQMTTYILCPNTVFPIRDATTSGMLPLVLRSNTTILCGTDGEAANSCVLRGGQSQLLSLPRVFDEDAVEGAVVKGVTFEAAVQTGALLGSAGDVSFVGCVFREHTNAGVVRLTWSPEPDFDGPFGGAIDTIVDTVNDFTPERSGENGRRKLSHVTTQNPLPDGCVMEDFDHDLSNVPAVLADNIRCADYCGAGQDLALRVVSVCTDLSEEGCENTASCVVSGCNDSCDVESGECDCTDLFTVDESTGNLSVNGVCEQFCTGNGGPSGGGMEVTPTVSPVASAPTAPDDNSIATQVVNTPRLSTLASLLTDELVAALSADGTYTLFAPTNAAFGKLPDDVRASLAQEENEEALVEILTYHVLDSVVLSTDLAVGATVTTLNGADLTVTSLDPVTINESIVIQADIEADNGVIHWIDTVLIPPSNAPSPSPPPPGPTPPAVSRQKVTFKGCTFSSNSISTTDSEGLSSIIVDGAGYSDVIMEGCEFSTNEVAATVDSGSALVVQSGSSLNMDNVCFVENDFKGPGVVLAIGEVDIVVANIYGTSDEGLTCEFVAQIASLEENGASCVDYDLESCAGETPSPTSAPVGAVTDAPIAAPAPGPTDGPPSGGGPTPTDPEEFSCSICEPGFLLSLPSQVVQIPPGIAPSDITEAPCSLIDSGVRDNPDQFDESTCAQLRALYADQCGCIPLDGPTPVPVTRSPSFGQGICSICPEGEEITLPDAVIAIPEGFFSEGRTFATCELLQTGLDTNPELVGDDLCPSLQQSYALPCGCQSTSTGDDEESISQRLHVLTTSMISFVVLFL